MTKLLALALVGTLLSSAPVDRESSAARSILFIGNSFTYGAESPVEDYRSATVVDLNGGRVGGVPALFKLFSEEAGLNYAVSLETTPGEPLRWHWDNRRNLLDRPWNHVVLQEYSTLDPEAPGDPTRLIAYAKRFADMFVAKNPGVEISLTATWSRPDQTFLKTGHWYGQPITQMALDISAADAEAARSSPAIVKINQVGMAFNCAIAAGVADSNPFDGIDPDKVDLWAHDNYHASTFGYYLEALTIFGTVTGKDPRALGPNEIAAKELDIPPAVAAHLQKVAQAAISGRTCSEATIDGNAAH